MPPASRIVASDLLICGVSACLWAVARTRHTLLSGLHKRMADSTSWLPAEPLKVTIPLQSKNLHRNSNIMIQGMGPNRF